MAASLLATAACSDDDAAQVDHSSPVDHCGPYPISDACSGGKKCPSSPSDIADLGFCQFALSASQYDTRCGGHVVVVGFGTHAQTWGFDATGKLNYERFDDDIPANCEDGATASSSRESGAAPCEQAGAATSFACDLGEPGAGGTAGAGGQGA